MAFEPQRKLLNPKFEGYRLETVDQDETVKRFALTRPASQSILPNNTFLSFPEVQSRVQHNHLSPCLDSPRAVYVDEDYNVVEVDLTEPEPVFRSIFQLPKPIRSPLAQKTLHPEYPSAVFFNSSQIFVSDGTGTLYILTGAGQLIGTYRLPERESNQPFRIHSIHSVAADSAVVILSSRTYDHSPPAKTKTVVFDIWAAQFQIPPVQTTELVPMNVLWRRSGTHVPTYTAYDASRSTYLLVGEYPYRLIGEEVRAYEPQPSESAPIPRPNENLDAKPAIPEKPPPYSWTQTSDSVTVAFPLLSTTSKSDIHVKFTSRTLDFSVANLRPNIEPLPPTYSSKEFWDGISPSTSYWTWDKEGGSTFGLLTLYLDKQHEGTKWMQVFASSATSTSHSHPDDVEVPETIDPSELWLIRESLEKYTQALKTGEDSSGLGLGTGAPGLAQGEMDEEIDTKIGQASFLTWIANDGSSPPGSSADPGRSFFHLLATPLPGNLGPDLSIVAKHDLDGVVFSLSPGTGLPQWQHTATFSALAFVLASKQDTRFTYHLPSKGVFAFESGLRNQAGNVFIYKSSPVKDKWAKQSIIKIADGASGGLLGVAKVGDILVCLLERQLVLLKNI